MQIADVLAYARGTYVPKPRAWRRIDLTFPALCRDALDRIGPIGNILWLLAALVYVAWLFAFAYITLAMIVEQGNLLAFLNDPDWIPALFMTGLAGGLLWQRGAATRVLTGVFMVWVAGSMILAVLTDVTSATALH